MDFNKLVKKRCSVRQYKNMPIEEDKLRMVLEAGRLAPSAGNRQPWYFVVINNAKLKEKIAETYIPYNRTHFRSVPTLIVLCGDHNMSFRRQQDGKDHCDIDIAIAADHMTLQAAELGLGSCWICGFDSKQCSKALELPDHIEPVAILHIGYPEASTDEIIEKKRKAFDEVVFWDGFGIKK